MVSHMRRTQRATDLGEWQIGRRRARIVSEEVDSSTETTEACQSYLIHKSPLTLLTDQQVYGAGTSSLFAVQVAEDESTFSVVDNARNTAKMRGFGRGGGTVFRGRGQRGATQRGGRGAFQRVGQGRGAAQTGNQYYDNRGGRGARGRRFGWKDYDKPQRNRDSSVNIRPDWSMKEEIDFARLMKLNLETSDGEDVDNYGFLYYYARAYDKPPVKN